MMMTQSRERPEKSPSARLHHLLQPGLIVAPFVDDGLQAKIAQQAGLHAVGMTGVGTAALRGRL